MNYQEATQEHRYLIIKDDMVIGFSDKPVIKDKGYTMKSILVFSFIILCMGFYSCSDSIPNKEIKQAPTKKVLKLDMIQKDGKFISPRQLRAVTGDDDA